MIARLAALAMIKGGAERLQVVWGQAQVPVIRQRLDVIDVHSRPVFMTPVVLILKNIHTDAGLNNGAR